MACSAGERRRCSTPWWHQVRDGWRRRPGRSRLGRLSYLITCASNPAVRSSPFLSYRASVRAAVVDPRGWCGVDQHEGDAADLAAAVLPGVVCTLLYQDIAGAQVNLAVVEQHVDLARKNDRVVDAPGAVHEGAARRRIEWCDPHLPKDRGIVELPLSLSQRREVYNPQD